MKIVHKTDYAERRRNDYPSVGDQLDAYWKGPDHPDYKAMQATVLAVKAKYPKPIRTP